MCIASFSKPPAEKWPPHRKPTKYFYLVFVLSLAVHCSPDVKNLPAVFVYIYLKLKVFERVPFVWKLMTIIFHFPPGVIAYFIDEHEQNVKN